MSSRRDFLKTSGALVVSLTAGRIAAPFDLAAQTAGPYPDPDFRQLDAWIVIHENNTATFCVGKTDCGQGTGTAFRQMMADELDMAFDKTTCIMGSTDVTVDQGGSGGSDAIQVDGWPMRRVAAEARRLLLEMASARLNVPVDQLAVSAGVVTLKTDPGANTHGNAVTKNAVSAIFYPQNVTDSTRSIHLSGECRDVTTTKDTKGDVEDVDLSRP